MFVNTLTHCNYLEFSPNLANFREHLGEICDFSLLLSLETISVELRQRVKTNVHRSFAKLLCKSANVEIGAVQKNANHVIMTTCVDPLFAAQQAGPTSLERALELMQRERHVREEVLWRSSADG